MGVKPEPFGDQLVELLPQLMKEISRYENNYVTMGKITCQQFLVLDYLSQEKEWKMKDFVDSIHASFSSTTEMLDRLVKHGLAKRNRGKEDRRTVFVSATAKGHKIVEEVYQQKKEGIVQLFKRLTDEEREEYLNIIKKLVQNLSTATGE